MPRPTDQLKALETILADELKMPIHFTSREIEREVIVAAGRYQFHPLGDLPNERFVHLGTGSFPSNEGGGGSGSLREMLDWLGNRVELPGHRRDRIIPMRRSSGATISLTR